MVPPERMYRIRNYLYENVKNSPSKKLLLVFVMLCMFVGNMAVGYTFMDLVQQLKHLDTTSIETLITYGMPLLTSIAVTGIAIGGLHALRHNDIEKLNVYIRNVLLSLILQSCCTIDKVINMSDPARDMIKSFNQNAKDLGLVEQRWIWDGIQSKQACCGLNSPNDYLYMNRSIPVSCCSKAYARSNEQARELMYKYCIQTAAYYKNGCLLKVRETQDLETVILCLEAAILIGIQLCGGLVAMWIARNLETKMRRQRQSMVKVLL